MPHPAAGGLAPELDQAVGIGERARLFGKCGRGQDHVGEIRGLREEDVLDDQHLELGQRRARVGDVRIRHRRVLAHDVHAADLAGVDRVHDLDDRESGLRVERRAPQRLERALRLRGVDAPIVGIHHRDQSGIARALHVVLAAQRMEPRARPPDLSGHERQRDQAARVVGAVDVLRNPHAPQDHRPARSREQPRDLADRRRGNPAHGRHRFGAVAGDVLPELVVAARATGNEALRHQSFVDDRVQHRVQQRDVGIGFQLQEMGGVAGELRAARLDQDQLRAALRPRS